MESFNSAHAFGLSLVDQGHFAAEEIQENCDEMNLVKDELMESWEEKQIELSQSYELQVGYTCLCPVSFLAVVGSLRFNASSGSQVNSRLRDSAVSCKAEMKPDLYSNK